MSLNQEDQFSPHFAIKEKSKKFTYSDTTEIKTKNETRADEGPSRFYIQSITDLGQLYLPGFVYTKEIDENNNIGRYHPSNWYNK